MMLIDILYDWNSLYFPRNFRELLTSNHIYFKLKIAFIKEIIEDNLFESFR